MIASDIPIPGCSRRYGNLLARLGGAQLDLLAEADDEPQRARFVRLGGSLLMNAVVALSSMAYALVTALGVPLLASALASVVWGIVILNLDRAAIIGIKRAGGWRKGLLVFLPRVVLAALVGVVTAMPLMMGIFQQAIEGELAGRPTSGLLAQLEAMQQLSDGSTTFAAAWTMLLLLFVTIQLLPVLTKLMSTGGPETRYDKLLSMRETEFDARAETERTRPHRLASRMLECAVGVIPQGEQRDRYREEFDAELDDLAAQGACRQAQLAYTLRLTARVWLLRHVVREPSRAGERTK